MLIIAPKTQETMDRVIEGYNRATAAAADADAGRSEDAKSEEKVNVEYCSTAGVGGWLL